MYIFSHFSLSLPLLSPNSSPLLLFPLLFPPSPALLSFFLNFFPRAFHGKHLSLTIRFPNQGKQVDDLDILSHTNDTVGSIRRHILSRIKANIAHKNIELSVGGELIGFEDDRKPIGQLNLKDKSLITAKLIEINSSILSSPDSSSDSSVGSPENHCNRYTDGPGTEVESYLPGVVSNSYMVVLYSLRP